MRNTKMLLTIFIVLIVSSTIFAQVEKTVKETKVKIEKVEKKAMEAKKMRNRSLLHYRSKRNESRNEKR